jgi:hypothetical protein
MPRWIETKSDSNVGCQVTARMPDPQLHTISRMTICLPALRILAFQHCASWPSSIAHLGLPSLRILTFSILWFWFTHLPLCIIISGGKFCPMSDCGRVGWGVGGYLEMQGYAKEDMEVLVDKKGLSYTGQSQSYRQSQPYPCNTNPSSAAAPQYYHRCKGNHHTDILKWPCWWLDKEFGIRLRRLWFRCNGHWERVVVGNTRRTGHGQEGFGR